MDNRKINPFYGKKIVCLGGGIGTSNVLKGLKEFSPYLTVITSMADDGGSAGRLRKAYNVMPPGDIVNSIAALIDEKEMAALLLHRFPGVNKTNKAIDGHKLGNLIMLAEMQRTGDFYKAIDVTKRLFGVTAELLPATDQRVHLIAITKDGRRVHSETTLDLALYSEPHGIKKVYLTPKQPPVNQRVITSILEADYVISGPGDLYTNQLPVLIVPEIRQALIETKAQTLFVGNIANKPFETKGYSLQDFVTAITEHLGAFPFKTVLANNNYAIPIPKKYRYKYISIDKKLLEKKQSYTIVQTDLVFESFPLYHDPIKLASAIVKLYNK